MQYKIFRYFAYSLEMIIFFVLDRTPIMMLDFWSNRVSLIVPIVFMIALFEGEKVGVSFGVFAGVLLDSSVGYSWGFFVILLGILGYIIGLISRDIINVTFLTAMLVCAVATVVFFIFSFFYYNFAQRYQNAWYIFWRHYLIKIAFGLLTLPIVYYLNRPLAINLNEQ